MSQTVLLVSEQRMKQWTQLDDNIRMNEITPHILQAQDIYIQNSCGSLLYKRLKEGIVANDLNANENELLRDYIGPTLMQYALYLMLPSIKYKIVNQGILNGTSEETAPTTLEELKYIMDRTLDTAEFYNKRLIKFFFDNPGMFPQYDAPGTDGMMPDKRNPYFSGLVTGRANLSYYEQKYGECTDCGPSATYHGDK